MSTRMCQYLPAKVRSIRLSRSWTFCSFSISWTALEILRPFLHSKHAANYLLQNCPRIQQNSGIDKVSWMYFCTKFCTSVPGFCILFTNHPLLLPGLNVVWGLQCTLNHTLLSPFERLCICEPLLEFVSLDVNTKCNFLPKNICYKCLSRQFLRATHVFQSGVCNTVWFFHSYRILTVCPRDFIWIVVRRNL